MSDCGYGYGYGCCCKEDEQVSVEDGLLYSHLSLLNTPRRRVRKALAPALTYQAIGLITLEGNSLSVPRLPPRSTG